MKSSRSCTEIALQSISLERIRRKSCNRTDFKILTFHRKYPLLSPKKWFITFLSLCEYPVELKMLKIAEFKMFIFSLGCEQRRLPQCGF